MQQLRLRRSRAATYVSAAALTSVLAVPAVASATVTTTHVDTPAPESVLEGNSLIFDITSPDEPGSTVAISGTAPGADPGDLVDLVCTVGISGLTNGFPLAENVPVDGAGRFTAPDAKVPPYTCRVRAVPADLASGPEPSDGAFAAFTGPRVLGGSFSLLSDLLAQRADAPEGESYFASRGQGRGFSIAMGLGFSGLYGSGPGVFGAGGGVLATALVDDTELHPVLGGVGLLTYFGNPSAARAADYDGAPLMVDGLPGTGAIEVGGDVSRVVSHDLDPVTGDLRIVESAPVAVFEDGQSEPVASGITIERTFVQDHDGQLFTFHDVFRSTDGAAHRVEARYAEGGEQILSPSATAPPTYRVPWATGDAYVQREEGDTFGPAPAGRATIYTRTSPLDELPDTLARATDDPETDEGAYDFDSAPTDGAFVSPSTFVVRFVRDVPADGTATVSHRYAQAPTLDEVREILDGKPAPSDPVPPLVANTPLPQAPPVTPPVAVPGVPKVVNPLPRIASSTKKLLLTSAQGARLRDRKPVTVKVAGVPAGRYGITVRRFARNGKALASGTTQLAKSGDLAVTLRLTAYGRRYFGLKRARERGDVRTLVKVTWTPPGQGRKSRSGVFVTRFR